MTGSSQSFGRRGGGFVGRSILALTVSVVLLIWVVIGACQLYIDQVKGTSDSLVEVVRAVADESVEVTNLYLGEGETSGRMASQAVIGSGGDLTSALIETTMLSIVDAHESVDGAFVGLPSGDFYYVTKSGTTVADGFRIKHISGVGVNARTVTEYQFDSGFQAVSSQILVDDVYDPRQRLWYTAALERGSGWTDPYVFASSEEPGVTHYQMVRDRSNELLGVVGIDVRLADLTVFLAERLPSEHGEAVIIDNEGGVIAGLPATAMGPADRQLLAKQHDLENPGSIAVTELEVANERQVAALERVGADRAWTLVVSAPDRDFSTGLGALQRRTRVILPTIGLVLTLAVLALGATTKRRIERLQLHAISDPLTGLRNRSELRRQLGDKLEESGEQRIAIVGIDLDDFGQFNDELGHEVGDLVLVSLAERLVTAAGPQGLVGRVGGDEFMIVIGLLPDLDPVLVVGSIAAQVCDTPVHVDGRDLDLVLSAGVSIREPGQRKGLETVLREADLALVTAKYDKPSIVLYDEEMSFPSLRDAKRSAELRTAVQHNQIEFFFQPEIELATGRIVGAEALMRWVGPDGSVAVAETFIVDMERLGIVDLLAPQLLQASSELATRVRSKDFTLRINVTASQLRNTETMRIISETCHQSPVSWCIEITERTMVESTRVSRQRLEALVASGVDLALDDFGTGYSSLAELAKLPITTIKIDGAFVHGLTPTAAPTSLASAIADLAARLELHLVAEGIEREDQREALQLIGCHRGQGFLFAEAVPIDEFMMLYSLSNQPVLA